MPGQPLNHGIVDTRLNEPAQCRMAQIVIVEIMYTCTFTGIDPTMLEGIPILPLLEEPTGNAGLLSVKHDQRKRIHRERLRHTLEPASRCRHNPVAVSALDEPFPVCLDQFALT
jgi:hypothetical protein